jgi:GT2 family glycosyltransferase
MLTGGCDTDLVVRARDAGFNNAWAPKAIVRHLVPSYRLEQDHIRWTCLQGACASAYIDWKRWGWQKALLVCIARLGYMLIVSVPFLLLGYLRRSRTAVLDNKIQLWRNIGYTRKILLLLAPMLFAQNKFFYSMNFRKERDNFSKDSRTAA